MRRLMPALALMVLVAACTSTPSEPDVIGPESYIAELRPVAVEGNIILGQIVGILATTYDDRGLMYQALGDLRVGGQVAIVIDKAQRVEPAAGFEASHERYLAYLGELLAITSDLDAAIAAEDLEALGTVMIRLRSAESALALALPAGMCSSIAPAGSRDLCVPDEPLEGYEGALDVALRRFVGAYRPVEALPQTFGNTARSALAVEFSEQIVAVIERSRSDIAALTPDPAVESIHRIVVQHLDDLRAVWEPFIDAGTFSDPLLIAVLDAAVLDIRCAAADDIAVVISGVGVDSRIAEAVDIWFAPEECDA